MSAGAPARALVQDGHSGPNIVSLSAWISSAAARPRPTSGTSAASQTACVAPTAVAMAGSRSPPADWATTTGSLSMPATCPAAIVA